MAQQVVWPVEGTGTQGLRPGHQQGRPPDPHLVCAVVVARNRNDTQSMWPPGLDVASTWCLLTPPAFLLFSQVICSGALPGCCYYRALFPLESGPALGTVVTADTRPPARPLRQRGPNPRTQECPLVQPIVVDRRRAAGVFSWALNTITVSSRGRGGWDIPGGQLRGDGAGIRR